MAKNDKDYKPHEMNKEDAENAADDLAQITDFYRAQLRRGYVDQEQQHDIERHLARLQRTIGAQVEAVRTGEGK